MTGAALAGLAEAYVAAINNGAVPVISTAWQVRWSRSFPCSNRPNDVSDGPKVLVTALDVCLLLFTNVHG